MRAALVIHSPHCGAFAHMPFGQSNMHIRVRPRFFDQVGHQTTNASTY